MNRRFVGIDLLRIVAAILVTLYHLAYFWWIPRINDRPDIIEGLAWLRPIVSGGWVGVEIFFVISGFVIAMSAEGRTLQQFLGNRVLRLYPATWICATISMIAVTGTPAEYLRSLTLWPIGPWVDGVYWTLAVELVFYALIAGCLWIRGSDGLAMMGLGLGFYSTAFWLARAANSLAGKPLSDLFGLIENNAGYLLLLHFGSFFATGMMLWFRRFWSAGLFGIVSLVGLSARSVAIVPSQPGSPHWTVPVAIWSLSMAVLVVSIIWPDQIAARTRKASRGITIGGLLTYPIYLVHDALGRQIVANLLVPPWIALAVAIVTVFTVSYVVIRLERPIRNWLRQVFEGMTLTTALP